MHDFQSQIKKRKKNQDNPLLTVKATINFVHYFIGDEVKMILQINWIRWADANSAAIEKEKKMEERAEMQRIVLNQD